MRMKIQGFKEKMPIVFSVIIAVATIGGLTLIGYVMSFLIGGFFIESTEYYFFLVISEFIVAIYVLVLAYLSGNLYTLKRKGIGLIRSFGVGAYPIVMCVLLAISMYFTELLLGNELLSSLHIAAYLGSMLLIGVVEEVSFRGIIAETLIGKFGTSRGGIWKATALSGLIFGVAHIANVLEADLFGVFVQMAVATVLGMLFAAIYFRTGNLWVCILIHGGLDAASLMSSGMFGQGTMEGVISAFTLLNLIPCITYFIPVYVLLRKSKIHEVAEQFGQKEIIES